MAYTPPIFNAIVFEFGVRNQTAPAQIPYSPPTFNGIVFDFAGLQTSALTGFDTLAMGSPTVSGRNTFAPTGFSTVAFGTGVISAGAVVVQQIGASSMVFGTAQLNMSVNPTGWSSAAYGTAKLSETIQPTGFDTSAFGTQTIRTATQLFPSGVDTSVFGTAYLSRTVTGIGFTTMAFGTASVRTNKVFPTGFTTVAFGTTKIAFPLSAKPTGFSTMVFGTAAITLLNRTVSPTGFTTLAVSIPKVATNKLYPQGASSMVFGTAKIYSTALSGIGFTTMAFGTAFIAQAVRTILGAGNISPLAFGTQKIHTNKIQGIGFSTMHVADSGPEPHPGTFITLSERWILYAGGFDSAVFGRPTRRDNILRPTGIPAPSALGTPLLAHDGKYLVPSTVGDSLAFGAHAITNNTIPIGCGDQLHMGTPGVWPYHLRPSGLNPLAFGTARVHRNQAFPTGIPPIDPLYWYYDPVHNLSVNAQLGFPHISNRMQFTFPQGWDSSVVLPGDGIPVDDGVRSGIRHAGAALRPVGIASTTRWGDAHISILQQVISPAGWDSSIFGQTGRRLRNDVSPTGFDSLEFGDVQQWEAGTVKAFGSDMARFGVGRIKYAVTPTGISGVTFGTAKLSSRIRPAGIAPSIFIGPAVSNEIPCNKFLVVFPTVGDTSAFGNPGVST